MSGLEVWYAGLGVPERDQVARHGDGYSNPYGRPEMCLNRLDATQVNRECSEPVAGHVGT